MSATDVIWLTDDAYRRLTEVLAHTKGPGWDEVVARVAAAREEGDLKENGGYHAAREEQGKLDGEIKRLTALLEAAMTDLPASDDTVAPGTLLEIRWPGGEPERVLVADREMEPYVSVAVYSPQSPLVTALLGHSAGETVEYLAPNGKTLKVEVVSVEPFSPEVESTYAVSG